MSAKSFLPVLLLIALCGPPSAPAVAQEPPAARTDLFPALYEKLDADTELQSLWRACPADIYRGKAAFWVGHIDSFEVDVAECEADPLGCHRACFQGLNENACFSLALALQYNAADAFSRHWEAMFARACAAGSAGGCTNRAAGIRNGDFADDPFASVSPEARDGCLFRTFQTSCGAGDAWGCFMHGQSYQYGEGVAANHDKAAEFYRKSCDIDPDFEACDYAKEQLEGLR